jgi:hypothetical protein
MPCRSSRKFVDDFIRCRGPCGTSRSGLRERNVRLVIRYQGSATIRQGTTVIEGDCVVESGGDQLAEPDLPWSGRFHDPAPMAYLEEGRAWLRLNDEPVREGAIKITRAGAGAGAGLIDFDGIGSLR